MRMVMIITNHTPEAGKTDNSRKAELPTPVLLDNEPERIDYPFY